MPAYNFQAQFAAQVRSGAKRTTIRPRRKRPTVVGDRLFLFTGMRQSGCRLLLDTECSKVTPIKILSNSGGAMVFLDGRLLEERETIALAVGDGFPDWQAFRKFFFETYGPEFTGELIEWSA